MTTMRAEVKRHSIAAIVAMLFVGPFLFALADREPPYDRVVGRIMPENPAPGSTIEAEWTIRTNRSCSPSSNRNVTRRIVDSHNVLWDFETVPSVYGRELSARDSPDRIVRIFALPQGVATGPARYKSSACFACNPVQQLWPICIDRPDIEFMIGGPTARGPK